jgi:NADH-quinone oxidoreductase subunit F
MTANLEQLKKGFDGKMGKLDTRVIVCAGTGCVANGSLDVYDKFNEAMKEKGLAFAVSLKEEGDHRHLLSISGCQGFCQVGPLVTIEPGHILYTKVRPGDVGEIIEKTLLNGELVERLLYMAPEGPAKTAAQIPYYKKQQRRSLAFCGSLTHSIWTSIYQTEAMSNREGLFAIWLPKK